jgi:hypothetical protein
MVKVRVEESVARLDRLRIQQDLFKQRITLSSLVDLAISYDTLLFQRTWESYAHGLPLSSLGLHLLITGWSVLYVALIAATSVVGNFARVKA